VRSTRMPPQMRAVEEQEEAPTSPPREPYRDHPKTTEANKSPPAPGVASAAALTGGRRRSLDSDSETSDDEPFAYDSNRVSDLAPSLGPIETGGGIELPSRVGSRASRATAGRQPSRRTPTIPRRSSRRTPSTDLAILEGNGPNSPPRSANQHLHPTSNLLPIRLPFGSSEPSPERSPGHSAASSVYRNSELAPTPTPRGGGPLNTGYVQHHRTQDSLQSDGYDAADKETAAEFVDRSQSGSTQMSGNSRRLRH
jgi:hypothetical protein